jgi:NADPH-dependent curcumin reductase CurA
MINHQILLAELPDGALAEHHFRSATSPVADPGPGEVLVRTILLSIDPAARAWMAGRTYRSQLEPGTVMPGFAVAEVMAGDLPAGTVVACDAGWQEYAVLPAAAVRPIQVRGELAHYLGALGITGLTAYFGLLEVGKPRSGDTVVVSAAAGATGSVAGQLARRQGCRVVGITGSAAKNQLLEAELGFDATVDHHSPALFEDLRSACPTGVDVYFDNVGGRVLETVLPQMNVHGTIVCCGVVSQYDTASPAPGPRSVPGLLVTKRLRMQGFLVTDYHGRWPAAEAELAALIDSGEVKIVQEIIDGLASAPRALIGMLAGENVGKRIVRAGQDPG